MVSYLPPKIAESERHKLQRHFPGELHSEFHVCIMRSDQRNDSKQL